MAACGTVAGYSAGCHCDRCRGAIAAYRRARRRATARAPTTPRRKPSDPADRAAVGRSRAVAVAVPAGAVALVGRVPAPAPRAQPLSAPAPARVDPRSGSGAPLRPTPGAPASPALALGAPPGTQRSFRPR